MPTVKVRVLRCFDYSLGRGNQPLTFDEMYRAKSKALALAKKEDGRSVWGRIGQYVVSDEDMPWPWIRLWPPDETTGEKP